MIKLMDESGLPDFSLSKSRQMAVEYRDNLIRFLAELNGFQMGAYGELIPAKSVRDEYKKRSENSYRLEKMLIAEIYHFSNLLEEKTNFEQSGKELYIQDNKTMNDYE